MSTTATDGASVTSLRALARQRLTPRRLVVVLAVLVALVALFSLLALGVGSEHITPATIVRATLAELTGKPYGVAPEQQMIVAQIRLPRVLMAIVVGAAFSVAGAAYQALLRNPLADPGILGISTGAALGAIAATVFAEAIPISRPLAAFAGAVVTTAAVYAVGQTRRGSSAERLILAGVIVNAFLSSWVIYLVTASGSRLRSVFSWLIGDLGGEPGLLPLVATLVAAGAAVIFIYARSLNLMMTGEEESRALGVEVERTKIAVYIAASLVTGAAVAAAGVIGFVGLVIPHAIRLAGGSDNRLVLPGSALAGAAFLLLADTAARTIVAPRELHIGVITALIGAPVFVYLLRRTS
ncbi:MAG TPA: iron ABC transporter permease [Blastocatellia bacterium]|nr:iron ABC transporter permease [Blastocatellia bacterium]